MNTRGLLAVLLGQQQCWLGWIHECNFIVPPPNPSLDFQFTWCYLGFWLQKSHLLSFHYFFTIFFLLTFSFPLYILVLLMTKVPFRNQKEVYCKDHQVSHSSFHPLQKVEFPPGHTKLFIWFMIKFLPTPNKSPIACQLFVFSHVAWYLVHNVTSS